MNTAAPNPLDLLWTSEQREAARASVVADATAAAERVIAAGDRTFTDEQRASLIEASVGAWLAQHDAALARVAEIVGSPEARGREQLAKHLALRTWHSPLAANEILRLESGDVVTTMPTQEARQVRLTAMRGRASREAL